MTSLTVAQRLGRVARAGEEVAAAKQSFAEEFGELAKHDAFAGIPADRPVWLEHIIKAIDDLGDKMGGKIDALQIKVDLLQVKQDFSSAITSNWNSRRMINFAASAKGETAALMPLACLDSIPADFDPAAPLPELRYPEHFPVTLQEARDMKGWTRNRAHHKFISLLDAYSLDKSGTHMDCYQRFMEHIGIVTP